MDNGLIKITRGNVAGLVLCAILVIWGITDVKFNMFDVGFDIQIGVLHISFTTR